MKRTIVLILFITQVFLSFSQTKKLTDEDYNKSGAIKLKFVTSNVEVKDLAKSDIEKGLPFLLIQSGIGPVIYTTDRVFENNYQVYYYEQGCVGLEIELMKVYNFEIFNNLTTRYGKKWIHSVRKDVIGLKQWKRRK